jgi:hypothetical protein
LDFRKEKVDQINCLDMMDLSLGVVGLLLVEGRLVMKMIAVKLK